MTRDDPLAVALEDVASTAAARGMNTVYRYAMSAVGLLLTDAVHHRPTAEAILDSCRVFVARGSVL